MSIVPCRLAAAGLRIGDAHFATSCRAGVQAEFDSAVALLHSFEFTEAEAEFREVEAADPACAIAAWGVALAMTERRGANAPKRELATGWAELKPWLAVKAGTEREQLYVDAVRAMYADYETVPGSQRWRRYLDGMETLRQRYPSDIHASLFYALGLTWTAGPGQEGLEQRRKSLAILLPIFAKYPDNPGAAHYIIHAADTPELAAEALPAARHYAEIAPDSPHALHMPSHIFNRLGYWRESIAANQASARVAADWIKSGRDGKFDEFHALNNIEYAELQLGEDARAAAILQEITALDKGAVDPWLPVDARIYFDVETHKWRDAEQIQPPPHSPFAENFDAYWVQAIAAAHLGQPARARQALAQFTGSAAVWEKDHGWGDIFRVAEAEAEAWTLFSEGKRGQAVACLKEIAVFEQAHPMYYADILPRPTAEMLGDMLMRIRRPAEALGAYQQSLRLAPNRFNSLTGAEKAAAAIGKQRLTADYAHTLQAEGAAQSRRP